MSNQYRGNRSPDSQGSSNRQSDDFGTQDRPRASFGTAEEYDDEFDGGPQGRADRQREMDAGHGSGSGRGYSREASQGWDQDYGFGGRQSIESGSRGGYTSQGYDQSNRGSSGGMRDQDGWDANPSRTSSHGHKHSSGNDRAREFSEPNRSQPGRESYRSQHEFGGREDERDDAYGRGGSTGGQSGYGQRGGMGYGEQSAMGYGEQGGRSNHSDHDGRGGWTEDRTRGQHGGGRGSSEDRFRQGGNRMYGDSHQRDHSDNRPRSSHQQQDWGQQRESQGSSSRGRERNRRPEFDSPAHDNSSWQQRGPHSGRGPKGWRRSDERVTEDICEALTRHPDIDATNIEVRVEKGEVTLTGTVDSREAKRYAEEAAERCSGVSDVTNQLRVTREDHRRAEQAPKSKAGTQEVTATRGSNGQHGQTARAETKAAAGDGDGKASGKD